MDFSFTAEQDALRAMVRDLFGKLYPPSGLRQLWDGADRDRAAWKVLAEQGLTGLGVAERDGGGGGDDVDLLVVLEEAGRACVPDPYLETVGVAAGALAQSPLASRWLPAIAIGDAIVTLQLEGQPFVVDADIADLILMEREGTVYGVEAGGFTATRLPSEDRTRRLFEVAGEGGEPVADGALLRRRAALATAATLNGVALSLLDQTLGYVKVRQQFGVPVGSFQAVKHKLASVFATLESSRAAALYAAYAGARDLPDAALAAHTAKAHAVAAESLANAEALQCHGGIGFTWEHDLHFWLKRGRALEHAYGSATEHRAAVAAALLDD